ncbi:TPA: DUF6680 family protein [Escherichia coli]
MSKKVVCNFSASKNQMILRKEVDMPIIFGMEWKDVIMTGAVILGPILAVRSQKIIESIREKRQRRIDLFRTLMATRAEPLNRNHVQALNMIDIEFYGKMIPFIRTRYQTRAEQAVTHAWKIYNSHLNKLADYQSPDGGMRTQELLSDLLYELSSALGYDFDKVQLQRDCYRPMAYQQHDNIQKNILVNMDAILSGNKAIPMYMVPWPTSDTEASSVNSEEDNKKTDTEEKDTKNA